MALFARLISYPPLSQVTVVPPRREGVSYLYVLICLVSRVTGQNFDSIVMGLCYELFFSSSIPTFAYEGSDQIYSHP